ncbi:hypothetical protein FV226_21395 [Methylobacterium sp. WL12]|uniref:RNA polymerase sigma factor region1.1 domain-containing protein n=1 Tax=Methylobacterium sp. WL12 TaxID=2603890 RepID=UPI0011C7A143|nr:RNA polymerase sigma factor region1.1 domain-containing protein [Methylobacterium sp. WL12]TXM67656.1 hypothetical protein FV226_21395 [Methylobacterium sp. WL12]
MAGTINRATLDRLIALGRTRGELTASEFEAAIPVDSLDVDALVLVMLELEEAGVSVEPDAFGPRAETAVTPRLTLAMPEPGVPRAIAGGEGEPAVSVTPPPAADAKGEAEADDPVGRVVLLAGLAVLLILGAILVLV